MSIGQLIVGSIAGSPLSQLATSAIDALFKDSNNRTIGGKSIPVTIMEHHSDSMTITDHPTEFGAKISDHAYANQPTLDMEIGYSPTLDVNLDEVYQDFLKIMHAKEFLQVITGKRLYNNMLIEAINVTTDRDTENVLVMQIRFKQILVVYTALNGQSSQGTALPATSAKPANFGTKSLITQAIDYSKKITDLKIPGLS